jgi:predicted small lipoprotein YifL
MKSIICALTTLLLFGVLAGCGQSGPLYVPGDPSSIKTTPVTPENEEENGENGESDEDDDSQ